MDDHDTGFHDHDLSAGAVAVVDGRGGRGPARARRSRRSTRTFAAGEAFTSAPADIHRVRHAGAEPAVTIHAYSPPLWRMGAYEVLPGGELRRHSLSYAEELRPLGRPVAVRGSVPQHMLVRTSYRRGPIWDARR